MPYAIRQVTDLAVAIRGVEVKAWQDRVYVNRRVGDTFRLMVRAFRPNIGTSIFVRRGCQ
jgi:hypothetical protein